MTDSQAVDVPIASLRPLRERRISRREYGRILASIKAIGLIEPLIVFAEEDGYVILDGVQRYKALIELGAKIAPCIVGSQREAFTGNRMVNRVSPLQEHRMIEKSLEELDEKTIASALGIQGIAYRLKTTLLKNLHPDVALAFDQGKLTRTCAREFLHVTPARQREILTAMEGYKDYGVAFVRTQILKTPTEMRVGRTRKNSPWNKGGRRKGELLKKLADAEQKHDFYSRLYKQYTIDLLRLAIFVRSMLTNRRIRAYLDLHHSKLVSQFEVIVAEARS
jgi:ParB family transcriptional regulator, chromosome partitioning protein